MNYNKQKMHCSNGNDDILFTKLIWVVMIYFPWSLINYLYKIENPLRFYKHFKETYFSPYHYGQSDYGGRKRVRRTSRVAWHWRRMALKEGVEIGELWLPCAWEFEFHSQFVLTHNPCLCWFIPKFSFYRNVIHFLKYTAHLVFTTVHKMG